MTRSADFRNLRDQIHDVMKDGNWHTIPELSKKMDVYTMDSTIGARIRELRMSKFGGYTVERKYISKGLFAYRIADVKPDNIQGELDL